MEVRRNKLSLQSAALEKESAMNNLYHWHNEKMVGLEMQELNREVERARLLREAGLVTPNWLARQAKALGSWLIERGKKRQERASVEHPASQTFNSKLPT